MNKPKSAMNAKRALQTEAVGRTGSNGLALGTNLTGVPTSAFSERATLRLSSFSLCQLI